MEIDRDSTRTDKRVEQQLKSATMEAAAAEAEEKRPRQWRRGILPKEKGANGTAGWCEMEWAGRSGKVRERRRTNTI